MKTLKSILLVILVALVSFAQAQKVFKVTDVIDGKTILQHAQKIDAAALVQTKPLYAPGMSEATFVAKLQREMPSEAGSFKHLYNPYFKYVYSLHKRGMTESEVLASTTGIEMVALCNDLSSWNNSNPGILPQALRFPWRHFFWFVLRVLEIVLPFID